MAAPLVFLGLAVLFLFFNPLGLESALAERLFAAYGRNLVAPADLSVRPTSDKVRQAIFNILEHSDLGTFRLEGARVVDLFAGTGALGLEALSRGARSADFVEFRPASLHALKANVVALRMRERTRIFKRDALPFAAALPEGSYDVAFADPPYESRMLDRVIEHWQASRFARVLAVEHARTHELPRGAQRRAFEDTLVTIYRADR